LTDMVFKPDNKSLISDGPFISGRIDCSDMCRPTAKKERERKGTE
jgi:hypothetical protein